MTPVPPVDEQRLLPALIAAHAELVAAEASSRPPALLVGWLRAPGERRMRFLVGGRPHFPPALAGSGSHVGQQGDDGELRLAFPSGARGRRDTAEDASRIFSSLRAWLRCEGQADSLWSPEEPEVLTTLSSLEDCVAHLSGVPFAWLIVAEPLPAAEAQLRMTQLGQRIPGLRSQTNLESRRLELHRAEMRYRELARARTTGLWSVHALAGATTEATARGVAAAMCSAGDLLGLPYAMRPCSSVRSMHDAWSGMTEDGGTEAAERWSSPFAATSGLLAAVARPPRRELPGIRLTTPHQFDVTPETAAVEDGNAAEQAASEGGDGGPSQAVLLGTVLDEALADAGDYAVARATLNRHTFVCGATGAGKSLTIRGLLEQLTRGGVPWLVIEPAKAEYARMAGRLQDLGEAGLVTVIRPGDPDHAPASLNPLEPEPGFPLQSHIDLVRALFLAAFEAYEPLPQVLAQALARCYVDLGWDLVLGAHRQPTRPQFLLTEANSSNETRYPSLGDLQRAAQQVVNSIGYGKEITDNVRGFIDVRVGSLRLGTPGRFFEGGHPLDIGELLSRNVVLEIEHVANDQDKAFLIGIVLIRLVEFLRVRHGADERKVELRHITVVEEAHRLLKQVEDHSPARQAVELFAGLLAEIRAYGEGIIVAEQIPSKILPDVIKNSALKVMHRLPAQDDRDHVGATMNLRPEQSEYVVSLPPGIAAVTSDGMDRPLLIQMPGDRQGLETAQSASLRPPVRGRRSLHCGSECLSRPCTLREMRRAQLVSQQPWFVLWIELLAVSHIIGEVAPTLRANCRQKLWDLPSRYQDCALAYGVDAAVGVRYPALSTFYSPYDFGQHLLEVALSQMHKGLTPCDWTDVQWQAGPYRWRDVRTSLHDPPHTSGDQLHEDTEFWTRRGLDLGGDNHREQLANLMNHPIRRLPTQPYLAGDAKLSGLQGALRELAGSAASTYEVTTACEAVVSGPRLNDLAERLLEEGEVAL